MCASLSPVQPTPLSLPYNPTKGVVLSGTIPTCSNCSFLTNGQQRWTWPIMRHEGAAAAPPRPTTLWAHSHRTRASKAAAQRGRGGENQGPNHGVTPCSFRRLLPFLFWGFSDAWETSPNSARAPALALACRTDRTPGWGASVSWPQLCLMGHGPRG